MTTPSPTNPNSGACTRRHRHASGAAAAPLDIDPLLTRVPAGPTHAYLFQALKEQSSGYVPTKLQAHVAANVLSADKKTSTTPLPLPWVNNPLQRPKLSAAFKLPLKVPPISLPVNVRVALFAIVADDENTCVTSKLEFMVTPYPDQLPATSAAA
ncbi:MAG: hypothetical protein ABI619_13485 [Betaproteobacteria bacterium]